MSFDPYDLSRRLAEPGEEEFEWPEEEEAGGRAAAPASRRAAPAQLPVAPAPVQQLQPAAQVVQHIPPHIAQAFLAAQAAGAQAQAQQAAVIPPAPQLPQQGPQVLHLPCLVTV